MARTCVAVVVAVTKLRAVRMWGDVGEVAASDQAHAVSAVDDVGEQNEDVSQFSSLLQHARAREGGESSSLSSM